MKAKNSTRYFCVCGVLAVFIVVSIGVVVPVYAAAPSNDDMASATVVASLPFTDSINNSEATIEGAEPAYDCGWNIGKTVWYSYAPSTTTDVVLDTAGGENSITVHVFEAIGMVPVGCNDRWDAHVGFTASAGTTYLISLGGYGGYSGSFVFNMVEAGPFTTCASVDLSEPECNALVALYTATGGASWTENTHWMGSDVLCAWHGIGCSGGAVVDISLASNHLVGDFSTVDLTSLSNLYRLYIAMNNLTGDMSTIIGNMPIGIDFLYLFSNEFTGTIPAGISSLTSLKSINLDTNLLSGDIAPVFSSLPTSLVSFIYSNNNFYGTIPAAASSLTNLWGITGFNNLQDGDIATVIGHLPPGISHLDLGNNNFTGTIPAGISSFTNLTTLKLRMNDLSGDLSTIIGNLPSSIVNLNLERTNVTGTIPTAISSLTNLNFLDLSDNPGINGTIPLEITGLALNEFDFQRTFLCEPGDAGYDTWKAGVTSYYPGYCEPAASLLFEDDFETGDFSLWTRFNDGNGYLYPCTAAAINGTWGACVDRGTDKRKQLIDETPINQVKYNVRFNIDMNSLWMAEGTRFRFIQVKMGAERPFFIVLKRLGGQYLIQLNTILDDLTKVKTGWYLLSNAPHTLEITWSAATGIEHDNGAAVLYIDDAPMEVLGSLDNDTIFVDTFKIGFTSRLDGKPISGIFYLDDIATTNDGHIGLVEP